MEHGADAVIMNDATAAGVHSPDDSASCSARPTMSTETTPAARTAGMTVESRDELERLPYDRYELGVDGDGTVHFHSPRADRVVAVAEDGEIETTIDLADRRLARYVAFVDDRRGWSDLNYAASFGDILMEAL
jgi:hypothetical protein